MSGRYGTIKDAKGNEYEFEPIQNTSYGEPDGLFGINCGHSFRYIEEGAFFNRERTLDTKAEKERNERQYAQSQEQRSIEREIRSWKREAELQELSGSTKEAETASGRVRDLENQYRSFCEQTGRTPRWNRTDIY